MLSGDLRAICLRLIALFAIASSGGQRKDRVRPG